MFPGIPDPNYVIPSISDSKPYSFLMIDNNIINEIKRCPKKEGKD